jgi:hypothetical protein
MHGSSPSPWFRIWRRAASTGLAGDAMIFGLSAGRPGRAGFPAQGRSRSKRQAAEPDEVARADQNTRTARRRHNGGRYVRHGRFSHFLRFRRQEG